MTDAPSQSQDKFIVRLPDGMRDKIKASADANNRSMNAEIVNALEFYFLNLDFNEVPPQGETKRYRINDPVDFEKLVNSMTKNYRKMLKESLLEAIEAPLPDDPPPDLPFDPRTQD